MLGTVVALVCVLFLGSFGPDEPNASLLIRPVTDESTPPFLRELGSDLTKFRGQIAQVFVGGQLQSQQKTDVVGGSVTVPASVAASRPQ